MTRTRTITRRAASVLALALAIPAGLGLAGCTTGRSCTVWDDVSDPQFAYDSADLVVVGQPRDPDGGFSIFGDSADTWTVDVTDVLKGDPAVSDTTIRVDSLGDDCASQPYPDGDQMAVDGDAIIFLRDTGTFETLTPHGLVLPFDEGAELPFERE